ncbi:MAG: hypothetical protein ABSF60_12255 [Verrucomicrobiota bacterium]
MKTITSARVVAFVERVKVTEPADVVEEFMSEFNQCTDPAHANLALMLRSARQRSAKADERAHREEHELDDALHHCSS